MSIGSGTFRYSASILKDKKLYAWGSAIGLQQATYINLDNESIKDVAYTSGSHIVLTESGKVYTAGSNMYGVLGDGTNNTREEFKIVDGLKDLVIKKIYAGANSVYAIDSDGKVWSWGYNLKGQLGIGSQEDSYVPVQIIGLEIRNIVKMAIGEKSAYAIDSDGQVYSWGNNDNGQLGIGNRLSKTVPYKVQGLEGKVITDIYTEGGRLGDGYKVYAIDSEGKLYGWGSNSYGDLVGDGIVPEIIESLKDKTIVSFTMTSRHSMFAIDVDGNVYSWGSGGFGELAHGDWNNAMEPKLIEYFSSNGIKVKKIIAGKGTDTIFAIDSEGNVYAWGDNFDGQLGINGQNQEYNLPVPVEALKGNKIVFMPSNTDCTPFAVSDTGKIFVAGFTANNAYGVSGYHQLNSKVFSDITSMLNLTE